MNINEQLKFYRNKVGKTQQEMADILKVDKSTYAHYESGRRVPNAEKWVQLVSALQIPVFPAQIQIVYPEGLLDRLEDTIRKNGIPTEDYNENYKRYFAIEEVLQEVFDVHQQAMNTDALPISDLINSFEPLPKTVMNVAFDVRGEILIQRAMRYQSELANFRNNSTD